MLPLGANSGIPTEALTAHDFGVPFLALDFVDGVLFNRELNVSVAY